MGAVDGATGTVPFVLFQKQGDLRGYLPTLREVISRHDVSAGLYCDQNASPNARLRNPTAWPWRLGHRRRPTQLARAQVESDIWAHPRTYATGQGPRGAHLWYPLRPPSLQDAPRVGRQPTGYSGTSCRATTSGRGTSLAGIGLSPRPAGGLPLGRPLLQVSEGRNQRRHSPLQRTHSATAARQPQGRLHSRNVGKPRTEVRQCRGRPLGQGRGHGGGPRRSGGPAHAMAGAPMASCRRKRRTAATPCSPTLPAPRRRPRPGPQRGRSPATH